MNKVEKIINSMGGRPYVMRLCGISTSQVSHFITQNHIPSHWLKLFAAIKPELDWSDLLHGITLDVDSVLSDKAIRDVRYARMRNIKRRNITRNHILSDGEFSNR